MDPSHGVYGSLPLDSGRREIRLIKLLPGIEDDPLQIHLLRASLDEDLDFNALSYAWGSDHEYVSVKVQGEEDFPISRHLHQGLVRLRKENQPFIIWIDAICINQGSIPEKNTQVSLMRDIYRLAAHVYIWLGEATPGLDLVFRSIKDISGRDGDFELESLEQLANGLNTVADDLATGISELLKLSWFYRTWIIQEIALPRRDPILACGANVASWASLLQWWRVFDGYNNNYFKSHGELLSNPSMQGLHASLGYSPLETLITARKFLSHSKYSTTGLTLSCLIHLSRESVATDPRDKIYGIMGMLNAAAPSDITIDYNITVEDLFEDVTRYLIFKEGHLNVLSQSVDIVPRWDEDHPPVAKTSECRFSVIRGQHASGSWIRDFSHVVQTFRVTPLIPIWIPRYGRLFNACYGTRPTAGPQSQKGELRILGTKVDVVKECAVAWYNTPDGKRTIKNLDGIIPIFLRAARCRTGGSLEGNQSSGEKLPGSNKKYDWSLLYSPKNEPVKSIKEAVWRTLICDKMVDGLTRPPDHYGCCLEGYIEVYSQGTDTMNVEGLPDDTSMEDIVAIFEGFQVRMGSMLKRRSAFSTEEGWIGLGPDIMREGDIITVLSGGDVPFVLRRVEDHYILVGECYVEGIMYGEVVQGMLEKGADGTMSSVRGQLFNIC